MGTSDSKPAFHLFRPNIVKVQEVGYHVSQNVTVDPAWELPPVLRRGVMSLYIAAYLAAFYAYALDLLGKCFQRHLFNRRGVGRLSGKRASINSEREHAQLDNCIRPAGVICMVRLLAHRRAIRILCFDTTFFMNK
jgi:hypothetical protein